MAWETIATDVGVVVAVEEICMVVDGFVCNVDEVVDIRLEVEVDVDVDVEEVCEDVVVVVEVDFVVVFL